jgi:hypothetical protein
MSVGVQRYELKFGHTIAATETRRRHCDLNMVVLRRPEGARLDPEVARSVQKGYCLRGERYWRHCEDGGASERACIFKGLAWP